MMGRSARQFTMEDQQHFAELSGDFNPMHMDPLAARRTPAGAPVVHGMHALLWALECAARDGLSLEAVERLEVRFGKFMYLGRLLTFQTTGSDPSGGRFQVTDDGLVTMAGTLCFGTRGLAVLSGPKPVVRTGMFPEAASIEQMAGRTGWLLPVVEADAFRRRFPMASDALGARRLSGLAQLSRLVGMVCPGLHSVFTELAVSLADEAGPEPGIGFTVTEVDDRFGMVALAFDGEGLSGQIIAFVRQAPIGSPGMAEVARVVRPEEFSGSTAFVAGGSRGLGAITAKLVAAGGGRTIVTYARGLDDAEALRQEIVAHCGDTACSVLHFDAAQPVAAQVGGLRERVSHLFYFATPQIFVQKSRLFVPELFVNFCRFYVDCFHELCSVLADSSLSVFYPSSVAVTERADGILEYSMAKQAGEMLCETMAATTPGLRILVDRLPRMLTDQTATLALVDNADPLEVMLPLVRATYALRG